jgi:hypothetical protein
MIKHIVIIAFAAGLLVTGCKKTLSLGDSDFNVSVQKNTLALGDTASFSFTGNPDIISFYSGEIGKRYEYRDRVTANGKPLLSFRTTRANGSQANSLQLLVSADFPGVTANDTTLTKTKITSSTWTDITSRATLSTGTALASGNIDLSDFAANDKPVFIAFKYLATTGSIQNKWTVDSFVLNNVLDDGTTYQIANLNFANVSFLNYNVPTFSPGFVAYKIKANYSWNISTTSLIITGATSAAFATVAAESWAIIGPINLKKVSPDIGAVIKVVSQNTQTLKFTYKYPAKGTYNATFTGGNVSVDDMRYAAKSVPVTVN